MFSDKINLKSGLSSFYAVFDTLFQYVQYLRKNILSTPYLLKITHSQFKSHIHLLDKTNSFHLSYLPWGSRLDSRFEFFFELHRTDTDTTIVQWYERSEERYTIHLARCSTHIVSVHSLFVIMMGEDEKNLDANQMRAMNKYFIY